MIENENLNELVLFLPPCNFVNVTLWLQKHYFSVLLKVITGLISKWKKPVCSSTFMCLYNQNTRWPPTTLLHTFNRYSQTRHQK